MFLDVFERNSFHFCGKRFLSAVLDTCMGESTTSVGVENFRFSSSRHHGCYHGMVLGVASRSAP